MTMTAFSLFNSDNLVPFAPFGASGVSKGSVAAFFGYLGFDEVQYSCSPGKKSHGVRAWRARPLADVYMYVCACVRLCRLTSALGRSFSERSAAPHLTWSYYTLTCLFFEGGVGAYS